MPSTDSKTPPPPLRVAITVKSMVAAVLVIAGTAIALQLGPVALVTIVALLLVGTLGPAVHWLEHKGVKRGLGIAVVFGTLMIFVIGAVALTLPAIVEQVMSLVHDEPALRSRLAAALSESRLTAPLGEWIRNIDYEAFAKSSAGMVLRYSARSAEVVAYLVTAVFLSLYIMIDRDRLRGGLYALVPRHYHVRLSRVLLNLQTIVGGYIRGQVLTSGLMAMFTFLLLTVCGVKSALALGLIAGLADVLPYVGVFLSIGPAVAAASSHGTVIVLIVLCAMLAYEELESRLLVPKIYGNVLKLPPSAVLFSLLVGGTLMGIPGALLALPVAATLRMLVQELRVDLPGEDDDDEDVRFKDARDESDYQRRAEGVPAEQAAVIAMEISQADPTDERISGK